MTMSDSTSGSKKKDITLEQATRHVRALLISAPNGLNIVEIQNDYRNIIGKAFPYRELGYREPLDLVKAMPDVVKPTWIRGDLILRGIADDTSKHIARLVANQKKHSKKRASYVISKRPIQPPVVPHYLRTKIQELLTYYPSGILGSSFCEAYQRHLHSSIDIKRLGFSNLEDLLYSLPEVVELENLKRGGYKIHGKSSNFDRRRTPSAPSVTSSNNSSRTSSDISSNSYKEKRVNGKDTKDQDTNRVKKLLDSQSGVCQNLKNEIAKILSKRTNGIWAARLLVEYKKFFGKDLMMRDYGFSTVVELADAIPDVVRIERPTKTGDWLLHSNTGYQDPTASNETVSNLTRELSKLLVTEHSEHNHENNHENHRENHHEHNQTSPRTPKVSDGVGQGTYFQKQTLPSSGDISLYVSHCVDPHNFWVIFTNEWLKLESLSQDLSAFYNSTEGDEYCMPDGLLSVGQVCCAWNEDYEDWYRAVVTGVTSAQCIDVFYADFGNTSRVALSELRILRSSFMKIPRQAIHSKLAYIKPLQGEEWSPGCCHRFYHIIKNYKALFGLFCGAKDDKLCLCLSDTSSEEDIHINDLLVDEGFAMFCPDSTQSPVASPRSPVRQFCFQQLETSDTIAPKARQAPGLPPVTKEQQFFNQTIAAAMTMNSTSIPEFPFRLGYEFNGMPYTNRDYQIQEGRPPQDTTIYPTGTQEADDITADDKAFIEEICNELEQDTQEEFLLKRLSLMDMCSLHVINYNKQPYVTSADVSALFWDSDVLRSMLRQKRIVIEKVVLSGEEHRELIEELIKYEVRGMIDEENCPRTFVTLYHLKSLPDILRTFNHPLEELVSRVDLEIREFENVGDDYWLVKNAESESTDTESESQDEGFSSSDTEQLALEELKLVIQAMQFRRKRILQSLMSPSASCAQNTVQELVEVENKMERLRLEVSRKEKLQQASGIFPVLAAVTNYNNTAMH